MLELNGAVDFTSQYQIDRDPFVAAVSELARVARERQASVLPMPVGMTGAEGAA